MTAHQGKLRVTDLRQKDGDRAVLKLWQETLKHVPQEARMQLLETAEQKFYIQGRLWKELVSALKEYVPPRAKPLKKNAADLDLPTLFDDIPPANPASHSPK